MDIEEDASMARKSRPRKRNKPEDDYDCGISPSAEARRIKSVILANTKPSFCLKRGIGSLHKDRRSLQSEHRGRLRHMLKKLMRQHKYAEASGVLSVLLKGTTKEAAVFKTRTKFMAALELIEHIKGDTISSMRIRNIYELWMKKLGPMKNWPLKDRFAVHLENILFCLKRGNTQDAHQGALSDDDAQMDVWTTRRDMIRNKVIGGKVEVVVAPVADRLWEARLRWLGHVKRKCVDVPLRMCERLMQQRGFGSDPVSNLVVGLAFYQLWYSTIPKELQLQELDRFDSTVQSETFEDRIFMSILNSEGHDAVEGQETNSPFHCDSNTSVRNDKEILGVDVSQQREVSMVNDDNVPGETQNDNFQPQDFYLNSAERSDHEGSSMDQSGDVPYHSIFCNHENPRAWFMAIGFGLEHSSKNSPDEWEQQQLANGNSSQASPHFGLPLWLLPLQLPSSNENLEDDLNRHRTLRNDHYKNAIKYLRHALHSSPPVLEAFHPLIQMLLLGDQVKEALDEVEKFTPYSNTSFQLRLKATILEHFDSSNCVKLSAIHEENLEKDPTCSHSLGRLISLHRRGDYSTEKKVPFCGTAPNDTLVLQLMHYALYIEFFSVFPRAWCIPSSGEYSTEKLMEMIALHLDATYAKCDTWKELACCFLRLSQCEEDCMSVCSNGEDSEKHKFSFWNSQIPKIFSDYESSKSWRLRCRWWLTRHFSQNILTSDIASGDWELLTYKAAVACYLYGREFKYVVKASECLEGEPINKNLYSILHMHANSCTGFYFNVKK
ncbi:hypothetical protein MTR67_053834 [Solanum verrucosum]|uniref:Uncharacterized protein n=1 Tax=Solanum verrucosum TaxID=315347 RepID=A0AAF0VAL1_SOLVR|nr:hypothetical protein MTR67_053834 [Solanum verrucosum]